MRMLARASWRRKSGKGIRRKTFRRAPGICGYHGRWKTGGSRQHKFGFPGKSGGGQRFAGGDPVNLPGVMVRPKPAEPLVHRCGEITSFFHRFRRSPEISGVSTGKPVDKLVESVERLGLSTRWRATCSELCLLYSREEATAEFPCFFSGKSPF